MLAVRTVQAAAPSDLSKAQTTSRRKTDQGRHVNVGDATTSSPSSRTSQQMVLFSVRAGAGGKRVYMWWSCPLSTRAEMKFSPVPFVWRRLRPEPMRAMNGRVSCTHADVHVSVGAATVNPSRPV